MADAITYSYDIAMRLLCYSKFGSILGIDSLDPVQAEAINKGVVLYPKRIAQRVIAEKRGETFLEFINIFPFRFAFDWKRQRTIVGRQGLKYTKSDGTIGVVKAVPISLDYNMWFWSVKLDRVRQCMELYIQWQHNLPKLTFFWDTDFEINPDIIFSPVIDESDIEDVFNTGKVWVYRMTAAIEGWLPVQDTALGRIHKIRLTTYDNTVLDTTTYVEVAVETDDDYDSDLADALKMFRTNLYRITGVDDTAKTFTVAEDRTADFTAARLFFVENSTANDEMYTVVSSSYDSDDEETTIVVSEALVDDTVDGNLRFHEGVA